MEKGRLLFVGFLLGIFLLIFFLLREPIRGGAGFLLKPFYRAESYLAEGLRNFFGQYVNLLEIRKENLKLKEENLKLKQELAYYVEREALYQRLEKLYKISEKFSYPQVVARIIYKAIDPFSDQIIIDKGSKDGLMPQMPVLALIGEEGIGLVGQVVEVHRNWSRVILLTDPSFGADVKILRTQERALLKGKAEKFCELEYLPLYSEAKKGDLVITSGQDLLFPPGLIIGEIVNLSKDPQGLFKRGEVRPFVDLYNLSWVSVMLKVPEVQM